MITIKKFGAEWCGPCRMLKPVLQQLREQYAGKAEIIEYDVDTAPAEAEQYSITSIPVVIIEKNGQLLERFTGLQSKLTYANAINEAIK